MTSSDLDAMARRVIDANRYMVLGTRDPDGSPRLLPVYYTPARYSDFYWASSPEAQHSRNVIERRAIEIGAAPLRLYVAHVESCEVHVAGSHPVHGRGVDTRQRADPTA